MGLFEQIAEEARATNAAASAGKLGSDDRFWKSYAYAFRLIVGNEETFFPLVINPETYTKSHPFQAQVTPTQEGGVFVERQGIIVSEITLEGHTGFKPRENPSETGSPPPALPLSGQAHFFRLQNLCFDRYSELVKDPLIQPTVRMVLSIFKDNEHWVVEPTGFTLRRTVQDRILYRYSITLKVLGRTEATTPMASEDEPTIKQISDAALSIVKGESSIDGAIADLAGVEGDLDDLVGIVSDVNAELTQFVGTVREFTRRSKRTIALPFAVIAQLSNSVRQIQGLLRDAPTIPLDIIQTYQGIEDALDKIGTYPTAFVQSFADSAEDFLRLTVGSGGASTDELEAAASSSITQPQSFRKSAVRPGDLLRVLGGVFQRGRVFPRYEGFRETSVTFGATLTSIAAHELGDARRWVDLALANGLQAPYISEEGLPGTKRPGDALLIPTLSAGGDTGRIRSSGSPDIRDSQDEAILGRDLEVVFDGAGRADLRPDTALGSVDFRQVAGNANLQQAINIILATELGANLLYQSVGVSRIVGRRGTLERVINAQIAVVEGVQRDPRILRTRGVDFKADNDVLEIDIDAVRVDNTQTRVIGRALS